MEFVDTVMASTIGGAVAGGFALLGVVLTIRSAQNQQLANQRKLVRAFLHSILDEIETLWSRYMESAGARLTELKDGEALFGRYPVHSDFFTMYHQNAILLGHIKDDELRRMIVRTYTNAKSLIDSFVMNNTMVARLEDHQRLMILSGRQTPDPLGETIIRDLINYARTLKQQHKDLKQQVQTLTEKLHSTLKHP